MDMLGPRIKQLRVAAQLNKATLARRVGVSDVTIFYWESGTIKQIGHERLVALAEALDCPLATLLNGSANDSSAHALTSGNAATSSRPWESGKFTGNTLRSVSPVDNGGYLVTPAPEADFDFLDTGDMASILPNATFDQAGLYLVERDGQLAIHHVHCNVQGQLIGKGEKRHHTETPLSPNQLLGKVIALWHQQAV